MTDVNTNESKQARRHDELIAEQKGVVAWARPVYARPVNAPEPAGEWDAMVDVEFHTRPEKPEGEGWYPLVVWSAFELRDQVESARAQQPAPLPAITLCDNCGCVWLDYGLNPFGCPYCKLSELAAEIKALRAEVERLR